MSQTSRQEGMALECKLTDEKVKSKTYNSFTALRLLCMKFIEIIFYNSFYLLNITLRVLYKDRFNSAH
jgi:hypothetical protein